MKSKKLISFLCAAALTASSFSGLTSFAAQGDKIDDVVALQDFNSLATGIFLDGYDEANKTDSTTITPYKFVTTGRKDVGHYTDKENADIITGNYYAVMEKENATDKYLRMSYPMFGDFGKNGRYGHVDFAQTYTADANTDYVIEFDAKFTYGMDKGVVSETDQYDPVLRIGTFDASAKTANAVEIDKAALQIGDDWVHVKSVTTAKGTRVFLNNSDAFAVSNDKATSVSAFGLYSQTGQSTISPPADVYNAGLDATILDADKHTFSPIVDIDNLVIYTAEPEKEATITISFKDENGVSVKDDVEVTAIVGKPFPVADAYKAPIAISDDDDNYYAYKSGADTIASVAENGNVVTLTFAKTAKSTVTFKAVSGNTELATIATAKAMPGETTETVYAHEYINVNDTWYQKVAVTSGSFTRGATYDLTAKGKEEDQTINVAYTKAGDVVSFKEAEDYEDTTEEDADSNHPTYSGNYPKLYASGGKWVWSPAASNYSKGFLTDGVEAAGTYKVIVHGYTPKADRPAAVGTVENVSKDEASKYAVKIGDLNSEGMYTYTSDEVELPAGGGFFIGINGENMTTSASNKTMSPIDYIVVKKIVDPEIEIGAYDNTNKEVALALKNGDLVSEADVKFTLIHLAYDGDAVNKITVYKDQTFTDGVSKVKLADDDTVLAGDKFYVWDSLDSIKPLAAPKTVTTDEAAAPKAKSKITLPTATGGTVTVKDKTAENNVIAGVVEGTSIELEVAAETGYELKADSLTITYKDGSTDKTEKVTDNKFNMPASDVTVAAEFVKTNYKVTLPTDNTVTAKVNNAAVTTANYDDTVDLTVTAPTGKKLAADGVKVTYKDGTTDKDVTVDNNSFKMPAADVTVTVTYEDEKYTVTETDNITASKKTDVKYDELITLTVNVPAGKRLKADSLKVTKSDNTTVAVTPGADANTYTFKMPADNVTVTAEFENVYAVTVPTGVTADKTVAAAGETVTLTVTVADDEEIKEGFPKANDTTATAVAGETNKFTFTMPAAAAVVTVEFDKFYAINVAENSKNAVTIGKTKEKAGEEVAFTVDVPDEKKIVGGKPTVMKGETAVEVTVNDDGAFVFTMPDAAVEISVEFEDVTYTVTGTKGAGVDTITVKNAEGGAQNPVINEQTGTYTYTLVKGTYTIEATAANGYKNAKSDKTDDKLNVAKDGDTTFTVSATAKAKSTVTYSQPTGGTLTVKKGNDDVTAGSTVMEGETVTVSAVITDTDTYEGTPVITVKTTVDETEVPVEVTNGEFVMPETPITITVTGITEKEAQKYSLTSEKATFKIGEDAVTEAAEGAVVTVVPTLGANEKLSKVTYTYEGLESPIDITEALAFTMPPKAVTVTVTVVNVYKVTGTVGANVEKVELIPENGTDEDAIQGTVEEGVITFTDLVAGTYTVKVTAADGYNGVSTPTTVTVTNADVTEAFAATATAKEAKTYQYTATATVNEKAVKVPVFVMVME